MMLEVENKYMYLLNMGKQLIESERININLIELIQSQNLWDVRDVISVCSQSTLALQWRSHTVQVYTSLPPSSPSSSPSSSVWNWDHWAESVDTG